METNALAVLDAIMNECNEVFEEVLKRDYLAGKYTHYRMALTSTITETYLDARDVAAAIADSADPTKWKLEEWTVTTNPIKEFEFSAYHLVFRNEDEDVYELRCNIEVFCSMLVWHAVHNK